MPFPPLRIFPTDSAMITRGGFFEILAGGKGFITYYLRFAILEIYAIVYATGTAANSFRFFWKTDQIFAETST